ncbi:hypothetical protein DRN63_04665 [Nanoarchaeota archaeon]|nr:MAG: hypothetical protein DRN63_04665 [Nanoarchaeota archaeon]
MVTMEKGVKEIGEKEGFEIKFKVPRFTRWMGTTVIFFILFVVMTFLYIQKPTRITGAVVFPTNQSGGNVTPPTRLITYIYPPNCPDTICNLSQVQAWSDEIGIQLNSYLADWIRGPVALLYTQDKVGILDVSGKKQFADGICRLTNDENACRIVEENLNKSKVVKVDLYVMSYCPFGRQMEGVVYPVKKLLKDKLEVRPYFILYPQCSSQNGCETKEVDGENVTLWAMHGDKELEENKRQACIYKYLGEDIWWEYVHCFNENSDPSTCMEQLGIDASAINNCIESKGTTLLYYDQLACSKANAWGSPTVFINGDPYTGSRDPESFKDFVCRYFIEKPAECSQELGSSGTPAPSGQC